MAAALSLIAGLSACGTPAPAPVMQGTGPLRVTNNGAPFAYDEGAAAKRVAQATCAARGQGLRTSIYDRYESGAWVFVEGCA